MQKSNIVKVTLIAAALVLAGFGSIARADEAGVNGSISGFANVFYGNGGAVGNVAGAAGTMGWLGSTNVNMAGRIDLNMSGFLADGFATSFGGSMASITPWSAQVSSSTFSSGSVSVAHGTGTVITNGSAGGTAIR